MIDGSCVVGSKRWEL